MIMLLNGHTPVSDTRIYTGTTLSVTLSILPSHPLTGKLIHTTVRVVVGCPITCSDRSSLSEMPCLFVQR